MGGHNPHYGGPRVLVGCSLGAHKYVCAHARPAASCECCEGPSPSRSPSRSPSQRAPLGQSGVLPSVGRFYAGGPPLPSPPHPPPPLCVRLYVWVCPSFVGVVVVSYLL